MSDSSHHGNDLVKDTTRKGSAANNGNGKLIMLIKVLVLAASLTSRPVIFLIEAAPSKAMIGVAVKMKKHTISRSATTHSG